MHKPRAASLFCSALVILHGILALYWALTYIALSIDLQSIALVELQVTVKKIDVNILSSPRTPSYGWIRSNRCNKSQVNIFQVLSRQKKIQKTTLVFNRPILWNGSELKAWRSFQWWWGGLAQSWAESYLVQEIPAPVKAVWLPETQKNCPEGNGIGRQSFSPDRRSSPGEDAARCQWGCRQVGETSVQGKLEGQRQTEETSPEPLPYRAEMSTALGATGGWRKCRVVSPVSKWTLSFTGRTTLISHLGSHRLAF